jgi:hypothetical protein
VNKANRTGWFVLIALLFFFTAHRLPAPISELLEKSPVPEQETKSKSSHRAKSRSVEREDTRTHEKTNRVESVKAAPAIKSANFDGTWSGTISQGIVGRGTVTLTINAGGTQVAEKSAYGSFVRHGTCDGRTASWRGGAFGDLAWTLTPNPDGQTALVSAKGLFSGTTPATFTRTQGASSH